MIMVDWIDDVLVSSVGVLSLSIVVISLCDSVIGVVRFMDIWRATSASMSL